MAMLTDWLPSGSSLLQRVRQALALAAVAATGTTAMKAQVGSTPTVPSSSGPTIENRSKKIGKVLLRLPGHGIGLLAQHRSHSSHSSHSSHYSGSSGASTTAAKPKPTPTPVSEPPARQLAAIPSTGSAAALAALPATSDYSLTGVIDSIDTAKRMIVIRDLTPLEAKSEFYFDSETTFTAFAGGPKSLLSYPGLPLRTNQKVQIDWARHPANPSKKIAVAIIDR